MHALWHRTTTVYELDVALFQDGNGDGCGDFRGLRARLDHLRLLGANCVWLNPFYRSPRRDGGYDVTNHLEVDPRFGDIADFVAFMERADEIGIRVLIELVGHHTSVEHPWFQHARRDRHSPYRDYYVWSDEPVDTHVEPMFPGAGSGVWAWDEIAGQYYRHTFYPFQPDLDVGNPRVRDELKRIMGYWLRLGVSGFRLDACSHMVKQAGMRAGNDGMWLLEEFHGFITQRSPEAVLMGETNVEVEEYDDYFGAGDRLTWLLDFWANKHTFVALARGDATPLHEALAQHRQPPRDRTRAVWLRNHDELNLAGIDEARRRDVFEAFAPAEDMRVFGRGIRRRLAPMLGGDVRRNAMVHSLLFSLPGVPVIRYGEEIGMGDDLSLDGRLAVRTPMQWNDSHAGGFSSAPLERLVAPPIAEGDYGYRSVSVDAQVGDPASLFNRIRHFIDARNGMREMSGLHRPVGVGVPSVLGLRFDDELSGSCVLLFTNLADEPVRFELPADCVEALGSDPLVDMLADRRYSPVRGTPPTIELDGYGFRWLRRRMAAAMLEGRDGPIAVGATD